jgi:hypothetical protein
MIYTSIQSEKILFRENFKDTATLVSNGGTVVGSPWIQNGALLDGTNDYITHSIANTTLAHKTLSFVLEFKPDFEYDEDAGRCLLDATSGARYLIFKSNNANFNAIQIWLGNSSVAAANGDDYREYWKVGERNVLVVASESGDTDVWLNGNKIVDGNGSAWNVAYPTTLYTGVSNAGIWRFKGSIDGVSIHNRRMNEEDAVAIYRNNLLDFYNKASVWLDMKTQTAQNTTKDVSGNGHDFTLGNGSTPSTIPDFSNPGYDLNGSTHYIRNDDTTDIYNNTSQSIVIAFKPDFTPYEDLARYLTDSSLSYRYLILKSNQANGYNIQAWLGNTAVANISPNTYAHLWRTHGVNVIVISGESGNTDMWLNAEQILSESGAAWTPDNPTAITLGAAYNNSFKYDGEIMHYSAYPIKLSPIQAEFISTYLMREYK